MTSPAATSWASRSRTWPPKAMGLTRDPRAGDALDVLRQERLKNGRSRASEMVTLNALRGVARSTA
jgi:hypothetical protein